MSEQFISYAQNYEDVILWRALKDVKNGFYIDVGAQDPELDSVTLAFYRRGWRGVNLEASVDYHLQLTKARPGDVNIHAYVGDKAGVVRFFNIPHTGLSTGNTEYAEKYRKAGRKVITQIMPVTTLASVLEVLQPETIHFLKVDVEGAEESVFRGMDFTKFRPWIILAEATVPTEQTTDYTGFDEVLQSAGYVYCYFDGLSRFYVSAEKEAELRETIARPPNCFDAFVKASEVRLRTENENLRGENQLQQSQNTFLLNQFQDIALQAQKISHQQQWSVSLTNVLRSRLGHLARSIKKLSQKIRSYKTKQHHRAAKKNLVQAVRKHFGKNNWKFGDPEPRLPWLKRLRKSWLRPQGSINKSLFGSLTHMLDWQRHLEGKIEVIEKLHASLAQQLLDMQSQLPRFSAVAIPQKKRTVGSVANEIILPAQEEETIYQRLKTPAI